MSDFLFSTEFINISAGDTTGNLPVTFIPKPDDVPLLCGRLYAIPNADPTATVQLTVNFGGFIFTTQVLTLSSNQDITFVVPFVNVPSSSIAVSYSTVVSGTSGEYFISFRIK